MTTATDGARRCALALLASLDEQQRRLVRGDLDDSDLRRWSYLPGTGPTLTPAATSLSLSEAGAHLKSSRLDQVHRLK
jgi:hypothetical protein